MGDASAGWGGPISRAMTTPVVALRNFFRQNYCSADGVVRGGGCDMYWVSVHEYRSSQTCGRCFAASGMQPFSKGWTLKKCTCGGVFPPDRQAAQRHDADERGQLVPLVLDRDRNAARVLNARVVAQLVPLERVHQGQLQQLYQCLDRGAHAEWKEQQRLIRQQQS